MTQAPSLALPGGKIFLVGFMGTGKSTLGRLLAGRIGWTFRDVDEEMEAEEGSSIMRIFVEKGEPYFRVLERRVLARLAAEPGRAVIACGGGTFCSADSRAVMARHGVTVWVDQPFDRIWERREELARQRPLLHGEAEVRALYERRVADYSLATVRLDAAGKDLRQAVEELLRLLSERFPVG